MRAFGSQKLIVLTAILALFGMVSLTTWHDVEGHVQGPDQVATTDRDHPDYTPVERPDTADLIHLAAHAVLQTIVVPSPLVVAAFMKPVSEIWTIAAAKAARPIAPLAILRPPRG